MAIDETFFHREEGEGRPSKNQGVIAKRHQRDTCTEMEPSGEQLAIYASYIRGLTYKQLCKKYGYKSVGSVAYVIKKVVAYIRPQMMDNIRDIQTEHTDRLLLIYCEAMEAWEKSKGNKVRRRFERVTDKTTGASKMVLQEHVIEMSCGDVGFLNAARAALNDIRVMLGANAAIKVEHNGELRIAGRTPQEAREELAVELEKMRQKLLEAKAN